MAEMKCPICGKLYTVPPDVFGKKVRCRACTTVFYAKPANQAQQSAAAPPAKQAPMQPAQPPQSGQAQQKGKPPRPITAAPLQAGQKIMRIKCMGCGAMLAVPESLAGQKVKCPKCGDEKKVRKPDEDNMAELTPKPKPQSLLSLADTETIDSPELLDRIEVANKKLSNDTTIIYDVTNIFKKG
ncbi:MAG: hypothetical protein HZA50_11280 [Planctomycetes bacterium]|nr:hypothetical protein [Planctomycetota bacterium]